MRFKIGHKINVLLLGSNSIAIYALNRLKDYSVHVIADDDKPVLPKGYKPDVAFSIQYPHILSKKFIDRVGVPILNFHTAPLPELRGVDTCSWAIVHQLKEFGVTVHVIDEGVDTGDIALKETFYIKPLDTAYSLYNKNLLLMKTIIDNYIVQFVEGDYILIPQSVVETPSYSHKRGEFDYTDLKVDLNASPEDQDTFIRSRIFPGKQLPYIEIDA